jgi:hypothetical protein
VFGETTVFYLLHDLNLDCDDVGLESPFKYSLFLPDYLVNCPVELVNKHLTNETFGYWLLRGTMGATCYVAIFAVIMYWVSVQITHPIVEFTEKIRINI